MIKPNETSSAVIQVVGEEELTQVVGGYCHGRRRNYRHCGGGWRKRERHCGGYESYESYDYGCNDSSDDYEGGDESSEFEGNNVQVASVDVTINIAQVQG
jgi:hypothetical protein